MNHFDFSLNGEDFLLFYTLLTGVIALAMSRFLHSKDHSRTLPALKLPAAVDAYEIAYFREQEAGLARAVTVALVERGYLTLKPYEEPSPFSSIRQTPHLMQAHRNNADNDLSTLEWAVYQTFDTPLNAKAYAQAKLPQQLSSYSLPYEESLQQQQLLRDPSAVELAGWIFALGIGVLVVVDTLRVTSALERGEPIGFLCILFAASTAVLGLICHSSRFSARGRAFQDKLAQTGQSLAFSNGSRYALATAIYGTKALADTPLVELQAFMKSAAASSSLVCSGDSSSDGGGGCGGCGG